MTGPSPLRRLSRANEMFARAAGVVAGVLLVGATGVVGTAVFYRYVLNNSLMWSEELTRYLVIWIVFLTIGLAHRWSQHVRIGFLPDRFSGRPRQAFELITELIVLVILTMVAWYAWKITQSNFARGQITPAMGIRIGWVYIAAPIGLGLAALQSLEWVGWRAWALFTGSEVPTLSFGAPPEDVQAPGAGGTG